MKKTLSFALFLCLLLSLTLLSGCLLPFLSTNSSSSKTTTTAATTSSTSTQIITITKVTTSQTTIPTKDTTSSTNSQTSSGTMMTTTVTTKQGTVSESYIESLISKHFKDSSKNQIRLDSDNDLLILALGKDNLTLNMTRKGLYYSILDTMKDLKYSDIRNIDFKVMLPLVDVYGNTDESVVIRASFPKKVREKINFDAFDIENIPVIAEDYWQHPALSKK